jgi:hypothetical protein
MFGNSVRRIAIATRPNATKRSFRAISSQARKESQKTSSELAIKIGLATAGAFVASSAGYSHCKDNAVYDIPLGNKFPGQVPCFVEVSKGSRNKYEW